MVLLIVNTEPKLRSVASRFLYLKRLIRLEIQFDQMKAG
jgi:hypothetical protein